jgi:hypothetical protein
MRGISLLAAELLASQERLLHGVMILLSLGTILQSNFRRQ